MADAWDLSVTFVQNHPAEAARVLEALAGADARAFLERLPAALGARVLGAMLPTAAARLLNGLDEASAHTLLDAASTQTAVSVLRHVPEPVRTRLVASLPAGAALAAQLLLGYPDSTVGAWTDPDFVSAHPTTSVQQILSRIRDEGTANLHQVYVTDSDRRVLGCVGFEALLRARSSEALAHCMSAVPTTLSVLMPIASARDLPAWERAIALPVVDHDRHLIGVLRRHALLQGLRAQLRPAAQERQAGSFVEALAAGYWHVVSALSGATIALLPGVKRVLPEE